MLREPAHRGIQPDGRVHHWGYIPALGRWLPVVTPPSVVLDFDSAGALVGIDIDQASRHLDLSDLGTGSVPVEMVGIKPR